MGGSPGGAFYRKKSFELGCERVMPQQLRSRIRRADARDTETVRRISADAYISAYMAVLGTIPKPAIEDYGPRVERGQVWILEIEEEPIRSEERRVGKECR